METMKKVKEFIVPVLISILIGLIVYIWEDRKEIDLQQRTEIRILLDKLVNSNNTNENQNLVQDVRLSTVEDCVKTNTDKIDIMEKDVIGLKYKTR